MRLLVSILAGMTLFCGTALGWGCEGHQMMALIARAHLTPAVSAAVNDLLKENPLDPAQKRYCHDRPSDPMADAASWADDMKSIDKTFNWHFIDLPLGISKSDTENHDLMRWCEPVGPSVDGKDSPGCLITAIDYEWGILKDKTQPGADRAKALRYLIHLLGDLSQPLHNTGNHDQGGNCTRITFFSNAKPDNLHSIWDERIIGRDLAIRKASQTQYAAGLDRQFKKNWTQWGKAATDIAAWAWEGNEISSRITYGKLKPQLPIAAISAGSIDRAGCNLAREQVGAMHIVIGAEYYKEALPVVREQLAKAGYRLAGLLNQSF